MELSQTEVDEVEEFNNNVQNKINNNILLNTVQDSSTQTTNENHQNCQINDDPVLININQINTDISFLWKIQAVVTCEYSKRTFMNTHGVGEVTSWDLTDKTGSITFVAFNLNSNIMQEKLKKNKTYEFVNMSIRPASENFKTLPHLYQLVCSNATRVQEIHLPFDHRQIRYNFTHLNEVNTIPLNSIIDVQVHVLRDYGISTGIKNDNVWARRELHVTQDGINLSLTLWNTQARMVDRNMAGVKLKLKRVKVSWFNGARVLITMENTDLSIV